MKAPESCSVAVIGAGIAGVQAAQALCKHFPDVVVLEASDRIGGRVNQVEGLVPWPVETGPEFIHGKENSELVKLANAAGWSCREYEWPDKYYFGKTGVWLNGDTEDAEIEQVHKIFEEVSDIKLSQGKDLTGLQMMQKQGASERAIAIAEVCYANDMGASLRELGVKELQTEKEAWVYGEEYLVLDRSLRNVVQYLAKDVQVVTNWPVTAVKVEEGSAGVVLTGPAGSKLRCAAVVVAVPLTVLQDSDIAFSPPLPAPKSHAVKTIRMGNAIKVLLAFEKSFWPEGLFDVCCMDSFLPEIWMLEYPAQEQQTPSPEGLKCRGTALITAFVAGEFADQMTSMADDEVIRRSLDQLDKMFAQPDLSRPASTAFTGGHVANWSKQKFIRGAYSFPTVGAAGCREALAAPIGGRLFFAGEATHVGVNPCLQAAMETGLRAAAEVTAALKPPRSRL
ncbi:hypothetical protein CYMTET_18830 [Cymbomonas tetramitiformis]|uniref:Amine oxidase domain-containing protein n=1 Tax=Cymbomonas tetramitiformis TaxID=36881 RepID=A0AAE0G7Y3_9CHLO|nr:hypothetical protein CYMTET_18830 [Cymbomonas tetramitiformis]